MVLVATPEMNAGLCTAKHHATTADMPCPLFLHQLHLQSYRIPCKEVTSKSLDATGFSRLEKKKEKKKEKVMTGFMITVSKTEQIAQRPDPQEHLQVLHVP